MARTDYADLLGRQGRLESSVSEARRAVGLDPLSSYCRHYLVLVLVYSGQFEAGLLEARAGIDTDPTYPQLHQVLALALAGPVRVAQRQRSIHSVHQCK